MNAYRQEHRNLITNFLYDHYRTISLDKAAASKWCSPNLEEVELMKCWSRFLKSFCHCYDRQTLFYTSELFYELFEDKTTMLITLFEQRSSRFWTVLRSISEIHLFLIIYFPTIFRDLNDWNIELSASMRPQWGRNLPTDNQSLSLSRIDHFFILLKISTCKT